MKRHRGRALINAILMIFIFACVIVGSSVQMPLIEPEPVAEFTLAHTLDTDVPYQNPVTAPRPAPESFANQSPEPSNEPPPESELEPEPEPEPTAEYFTIAMMGDCSLASEHNAKGNAYAYETVVGDDYAYPFSIAKPLYDDADFVIVNLECVLSEYNVPQNKTFRIRAPPEYVNILIEGGVDCAALGNNHTMDYGQKGYDDTLDILRANGVGCAPDNGWDLFTTDSGLIIGVYSKNTVSESDVKRAASEMKDAGAELIIMALHWGDEGSYRPTATQKLIGRAAVDAGAHIVMGTHPHTLQEVEQHNGGYIYYSLGNWSFGGHTNPRDKDSVIAKVTVMRDLDGEISVVGMENIPCSVSGSSSVNDYRPVPYEPGSEEYDRTLSKLDGTFTGPNLVVSYEEISPDGTSTQSYEDGTDGDSADGDSADGDAAQANEIADVGNNTSDDDRDE